jgi:hypothetical protein
VLRARAGRPFWHGSPDHFPLRLHRLLDGSVRRTVTAVLGVAVVGAMVGVGTATLWAWEVGVWALGVYGLGFVVLLIVLVRVRMEAPR